MAAAALDAAGNFMASLATGLAGYWPPAPLPIGFYRGWIGGIVSVDGHHQSRLANRQSAFYYLVTVLLQMIPYSLVAGAGMAWA